MIRPLIRWGLTHDREAVWIPFALFAWMGLVCGAVALISGGK